VEDTIRKSIVYKDPYNNEEKQIDLEIKDIGGSKMMRKRRDDSIKGQHAFMIFYDVTSSKSFANIREAYQTIL